MPRPLEPIPVNRPDLAGNEAKYLADCISSGWISSDGPYVSAFEEAFAERHGRKHGISVANGSVALDLAVAALKLGVGDEVLMPTFTIISCAAAVVRAGATPVFVDCEARTWNLDVSRLEESITSRTRAIMVVHIYGLPCNMDAVLKIASRYKLAIIEDTAQAIGQTYNSKPCGSFGELSTFSFYPNKLVTTGEGGMVLTDDDGLATRCRSLRNLAFQPERRFVHKELGWNFRLSNLQAAVGLAQLEKLDATIERKRALGARYEALIPNHAQVERPIANTSYSDNIYWVYGLVLSDEVPFDADEAMSRFYERGIGCRNFFWPMHEQPVFASLLNKRAQDFPNASRIARRGFYIPSGVATTDDEIAYVAEQVGEICIG